MAATNFTIHLKQHVSQHFCKHVKLLKEKDLKLERSDEIKYMLFIRIVFKFNRCVHS